MSKYEAADSLSASPGLQSELVSANPTQIPPSEGNVESDDSAVATVIADSNPFETLGLRREIVSAVQSAGYSQPTPVQSQIIPHVLAGRDVLAQSQTGSGKTAAFALPILSRLQVEQRAAVQVLVLAPTRELAVQVAGSFQQYGRHLPGFQVATIYGGQDYEIQFRQLHRRPQVVVGTPGRVIDHLNRGSLDLSQVQVLVLDEADEMLNMGFLEDVKFVLEKMPAQRQINLFSATLPPAIRQIADRYLTDPVKITIKQKTMTAESISQRAVFLPMDDKLEVLARFLEVETTDGVIVFTRTKEATITVAEYLLQQGYKATALNGDMPQKVRERAIQQLRSGALNVLVATDVAARGLDVPRISHVFNFDLPHDSESYIHRIGRTGRAGRDGQAIIFLTGGQRNKLRLIERATQQPIEVVERPTAKQVNELRIAKFKETICQVASEADTALFQSMVMQMAAEQELKLEQIAGALALMCQNGRPFLVQDRPTGRRQRDQPRDHRDQQRDGRPERRNDRDRPSFNDAPRRGHSAQHSSNEKPMYDAPRRPNSAANQTNEKTIRSGPPAAGMKRYRIEMGWHDGIKPGSLVGMIASEAGIEGREIGTINIQDTHAFVDLPGHLPLDVVESLGQSKIRGKALRLSAVAMKPGLLKRTASKFLGRKPRAKTTKPGKKATRSPGK